VAQKSEPFGSVYFQPIPPFRSGCARKSCLRNLLVKAGYIDHMSAQEPAFEAPPVDGPHNPVQQFGECRSNSFHFLVVWIVQDRVAVFVCNSFRASSG
jgi:hypothetical protein